ncbi:Sphingolipid C9-methyltransferase [Lachnellula hyalina]|uniref:sphingolipid C(9)-methyltransferase n=1 Tax=Lachnellula hyalina TaxID=1316788 RepID=A0A8H8RBT3_9HELO|nr:Sphingolipid C9-methyltransferase [Lachnellula hyalina]TVY30456.1 Sphingolipid C9-methyltransferase [Lachnellula hyalina]
MAKPSEVPENEIDFIVTPEPAPQTFQIDEDCGSPSIKDGILPADGPGAEGFSNVALLTLIVGVPSLYKLGSGKGWVPTTLVSVLTSFPLLAGFWYLSSTLTPRKNQKVKLPGRPIEHYLKFHKKADKIKYRGNNKIPIDIFQELYFNGDVEFNGDALEVLEYRHDWANFRFTYRLFKYFLLSFIPETKSKSAGTMTVGTTFTPEGGDTMLDIGCGWGTLARYASTNYGAYVIGVTLGRNQTAWGNAGLRADGIAEEQSKVLCMDYRDIPRTTFAKIACLEMAEHVGIRHFSSFLKQVYNLLDDDGVFVLQLSGLRKPWQYEDLIWGLFMNKYVFPGADASTPLGFYIDKAEGAGFEIKSIDTIGIHYSATAWRWYRNWLGNRSKVEEKYGKRWYRISEYFLASTTIASRQGTATCYQITLVKNLNSTQRTGGIQTQFAISGALAAGVDISLNKASNPKSSL